MRGWQAHRQGAVSAIEFTGLPVNHDIIEPDNPKARTDIVYPRLLEAIMGTPVLSRLNVVITFLRYTMELSASRS